MRAVFGFLGTPQICASCPLRSGLVLPVINPAVTTRDLVLSGTGFVLERMSVRHPFLFALDPKNIGPEFGQEKPPEICRN